MIIDEKTRLTKRIKLYELGGFEFWWDPFSMSIERVKEGLPTMILGGDSVAHIINLKQSLGK